MPPAITMPALSPELAAYYSNRRLMWKNVILIMIGNAGWSVSFGCIAPLMLLRMNNLGVKEGTLGLLTSSNLWLVSFLVMYFSWKSDHCVSKWGRRLPFLFISAPFIILSVALFPWFVSVPVLLGLTILQMVSTDMKASTYPLLSIDCIPKDILARVNSVNAIGCGLITFAGVRYGVKLADVAEWLPYVMAAGILCLTTFAASFIKEPPIREPATEAFKPWSALQVGWKDRRNIVMMLGVGLIHSFMFMYNTWIWLFAKNDLGIARSECAAALSWSSLVGVVLAWPIGWAIDRLGSYKVVMIFWSLQAVMFTLLLQVKSLHGLIGLAVMSSMTWSFYIGADMMVYKSCHPSVVGSMTSSNSFLRNICVGTLTFASGYLIQTQHSYIPAFALGLAMSTVGLVMFGLYYLLTNRCSSTATAPGTAETETTG